MGRLKVIQIEVGSDDPEKCGECPILGRTRNADDRGGEPAEFCMAKNWAVGQGLRVIVDGKRHERCRAGEQ